MTKFDKEFFDKFPLLYKDFNYIECDNGWYDLLCELSEKLEDILKETPGLVIDVLQVKSKFAGLRYYYNTDYREFDKEEEKHILCNEQISSLIKATEAKSYQTCEFCGKQPAKQTGKGWIRTICEDCEIIKDIIE